MIKVVLEPKDAHFERNIMQLRRCKSIDHINVIVDGFGRTCKDARVLANGLFGYTPRVGLDEHRVPLNLILHVTFYLEM